MTAKNYTIHIGDCLEALLGMPDASVDSIVTDPPYGLSFMGKRWDYDVPGVEIWAECLRVLKPGGHLLAFAGTRTQHRMAANIEDAGFEIRDMIAWVYGSGFPKSLDVSKAIDKAAGAEREVVGRNPNHRAVSGVEYAGVYHGGNTGAAAITAPATDAARQWQGWGTALKPALEPITVARKPLVGTVAANVLAHGTGAINVDGCRVPTNGEAVPFFTTSGGQKFDITQHSQQVKQAGTSDAGRWPANLIHDGSDEVMAAFPTSASPWIGNPNTGAKGGKMFGGSDQAINEKPEYRDAGSAARFFYCAKASRADRNAGCEGMDKRDLNWSSGKANPGSFQSENTDRSAQNHHPTVKPTDLMAYLVRLVTPPGGTVLDPFMGSGSTGKACMREGFQFVGCELSPDYAAIAIARIELAARQAEQDGAQRSLL